jgi:P-type Ca2+ transporter type 2C
MRSRSNSALGAATVMSGIVAGSIAAGWSPIDRRGEPDFGQYLKPPQANQPSMFSGQPLTDEPQEMAEAGPSTAQQTPILGVPKPPPAERKSTS